MEVNGEKETLADDLILGIDEHAEQERAAKDDKLEKEKRLTAAGLELRHTVLNRKRVRSSRCRSRSRSRSVRKEVGAEVDGGVGREAHLLREQKIGAGFILSPIMLLRKHWYVICLLVKSRIMGVLSWRNNAMSRRKSV